VFLYNDLRNVQFIGFWPFTPFTTPTYYYELEVDAMVKSTARSKPRKAINGKPHPNFPLWKHAGLRPALRFRTAVHVLSRSKILLAVCRCFPWTCWSLLSLHFEEADDSGLPDHG